MDPSTIYISHNKWAFVTSDNPKKQIKNCQFGSEFIVTFASGKHAAMANIIYTTMLDSLESISTRFTEKSVNLKDVKVDVLGGWCDNKASLRLGAEIIEKIVQLGFSNIAINRALRKRDPRLGMFVGKELDVNDHYRMGAVVNSQSGKTSILPVLTTKELEFGAAADKEYQREATEIRRNGGQLKTPIAEIS